MKRKLRRGLFIRLRAGLAGRRFKLDRNKGVILVHCVSVGEVAGAVSLIEALETSCPQYQVVVSTTTPQGMETAKRRLPGRTLTDFPFDFSFSVARFLDRLAPDIIALMELEAWPNFLRAAQLRKIPVVLANGRLTELSLRRYMKMSFFSRDVFSRIDRYLVQSDEYRQRFQRLGVAEDKIAVAGNIKFDSVRIEADKEKVERFRNLFGIEPDDEVLLGGSTYGKEEEILTGIYMNLKGSRAQLRLILAPRQLDRMSEVKSIIEKAGLKYALRSELDKQKPDNLRERVIVLDTVGELADAYALGSIVFVGGSLVDRGGHNIVEPAALGVPTLFGPYTYHFNQSTRFLLDARAAVMVKDAHELEETIQLLLNNPPMRKKMGENAQKAVLNEKGAVDRHIAEISQILRSRYSKPASV
jgi:3-deoxy-D-manno-octulosonic-acid transferase